MSEADSHHPALQLPEAPPANAAEKVQASHPDDVSAFVIIKDIVVMSIPLGLAAVGQFSIGVVLIAAVGKLVGVEQLGATSLAFGLINSTAFAFASGFCGALETVLSHTYGRDPESKLYGIYAQRMILMLVIIAFFLGPVLTFADTLLDAMGQNPAVAYYTGIFCRGALFGAFPAMLLELLRRYFACQHLNNPLSINLLAGALVFPFLVLGCIKLFGYPGAPLAWSILMTLMPISLVLYLWWTGIYKKTWGGWDRNALRNWGPLLKLALPSMAMMLSEWVSLEINAITAGFAEPHDLAAFSMIYQGSSMCWGMTSGVFICAAVMVGNALGQGRNRFARRCGLLCVVMSMVFAMFNLIVLFLLRKHIPRFFSDDEKAIEIYPSLLPYFMVYHFFDCVQSAMMGVLRGCGLQKMGAIAIALVYSIVGVPLGMIIFFTTDVGVAALWLGPMVGVSVVGFPLYCYMFFFYIKWDTLEVREEEVPALNEADDEIRSMAHSMISAHGRHGGAAGTCSAGEDENTSLAGSSYDDGWRGSFRLHHGDKEGNGAARPSDGGVLENLSFVSGFHIPHRNILVTPGEYIGTPYMHPRGPNTVVSHGDSLVDAAISVDQRRGSVHSRTSSVGRMPNGVSSTSPVPLPQSGYIPPESVAAPQLPRSLAEGNSGSDGAAPTFNTFSATASPSQGGEPEA